MRGTTWSLLVLVTIGSVSFRAAAQEDLEPLLAREIVGSVLPLAEVQRYCEARVTQMPEVEKAEQWSAEAERLRAAGYRVIAVDPFYFGESKIAQKDFLFALLVAGVGDRPLGLQASQVAAVARWAAAQHEGHPVRLVAVGPRSAVFALVAAALEEKAIAEVELHQSLGSLKEVIERNWTVREKPELFCFGLLEAFDVKQLAALIAPRPVTFAGAGERARSELAELTAWYRVWGRDFDPLQTEPPLPASS